MTDLDQIALDTVEAIANIDPDKLKGGRLQALAQAQCLVRDALQELEEVGAENYTLTQEVDAALEQVIYWRERAVAAEEERDAWQRMSEQYKREAYALAAHVASPVIAESIDALGHASHWQEQEELQRWAASAPTTSLHHLKAQCWKEAYLAGMEAGHHWTVEGGYVAGGDEEAAEDYVADRQAEGEP